MPLRIYEDVDPAPRQKRPAGAGGRLSDPERLMFITWVFELHAQRKKFSEIVTETGLSHGTIRTLIKTAYEHYQVNIEEEYKKDLALIDELLALAVRRYKLEPSTRNLEGVDKLLQRRAKMAGYDRETQKVQVTATIVEPEDIELLEMINTQKAKDARLKEEVQHHVSN